METSNGPKPSADQDPEEGHSLIQTSDGGYAIAGYTESFGAGEADVYVVKLDANGNLQWTKTIGGEPWDVGHSLIQTSDGGYAIAGFTSILRRRRSRCLCRQAGCQWKPPMDQNHRRTRMRGLLPHSDLRWRLRHRRLPPPPSAQEKDVYVVKLDANGNLQWTKTIGGKSDEAGVSLIQTSDGGYAIAGFTNPSAQESGMSMSSSWMPMVTSNGPKPSADQRLDWGSSLIQTSDGGYAIAGYTTSFGAGEWDVYVVKLDANGNLQWTKTIGAKNETLGKLSLIQTSDGGYAIAGHTYLLRRRRSGMSMSSSWTRMVTPAAPSARPPG
jgi:hypothetical protein